MTSHLLWITPLVPFAVGLAMLLVRDRRLLTALDVAGSVVVLGLALGVARAVSAHGAVTALGIFRADALAGYKTAWLLWPDSEEEGSVNNFKTTLSRLRKSFAGSDVLNPVLTQAEAVRINAAVVDLDASNFRNKATTGIKLFARGDVKAAKSLLQEAQDIYGGEFLPEEPFNAFLTATRNELAGLNAAVVTTLGKVYQQEGNQDGLEAMSLLLRATPASI